MDGKTVSALGACLLLAACFACTPCERTEGTASASPPAPLAWTTLLDRTDLLARLERARATGSPTVVFVWAEWCTYCRKYAEVIEQTPEIRAGFARLVRLRIDVNEDPRSGLRSATGIPPPVQPFLIFIDAQGRKRDDLAVKGWVKDAPEALARRLRALGVMAER